MAKNLELLSEVEQKLVNRLSPDQREAAIADLLQYKQEYAESVKQRRTEFSATANKSGTVSVYGLGQKFPVSLYPEQWKIVHENMEAILDACENAPARPSKKK